MSEGSATPFTERATSELARGARLELRVGDESTIVDGETAGLVLKLLEARGSGHTVVVEPLPEEITTGQAADLLGTSRPTVVAMVDRGELSARRMGTHRRLRTDEVLRLRNSTAKGRQHALDELTALSVDGGLYD